MATEFSSLVRRVVGRLEPPRVVSPAEYRAITCNRCGMCCEEIRLPYSPEELAGLAAGTSVSAEQRRFAAGLQHTGGSASQGWMYSCRHFQRDAAGLGVCDIYDERPPVCRNFPYDGVVRTWSTCAWYVEVRDEGGQAIGLPPAAVGTAPPGSSEEQRT